MLFFSSLFSFSFLPPCLLSFFPLVAFAFLCHHHFAFLCHCHCSFMPCLTPLLLFPCVSPRYFLHVPLHFALLLCTCFITFCFLFHDSFFVFHVVISCLTSTYWMFKTLNVLFNCGRNIKQCFLLLVFYLAKFWAILNHKLKWKWFFCWLEFLLTLRNVICKLKI